MSLYISALLLILGWITAENFPPWVSWHNELWVFVAAFFWATVGLISCKKQKIKTIVVPRLAWIGIAFLGVVFIQYTLGHIVFFGDALVITFYVFLCFLALIAGYLAVPLPPQFPQITSRPRTVDCLAIVLVFCAVCSASIALAQVMDAWEGVSWITRMPAARRPGGNLGQPNQLATLLLMGMASLLFLYESSKLKALSSAVILFVLCLALAVTESRTGVMSFLLLSGWWFVKNKLVGFRLSPWVIGLAGIGFLGFFWAWPSLFTFIQQSAGAGAEVNTKAGLRLVVWPQLLEALSQRPWVGWGLNQVPKAHNAVAHAYAVSDTFSYSHNILLDLALGMGVPLTALLVPVAGVWLLRRVRAANQLLPWYCLAVALPVAVHSMLEFPFAYAYFLVPVMFVLGALESMAGGKPAFHIGVRSAAALVLVVSGAAAWSVVEYVAIEEDFRVARFESLRVGKTPLSYQKPDVVLLTQLGALLDGARLVPKPGMGVDELALAQKVALRYPWTATQNRYALSLALNGSPKEALRQLRVMRAMHGEKTYSEIKANWNGLAQDKYPQLRELKLP